MRAEPEQVKIASIIDPFSQLPFVLLVAFPLLEQKQSHGLYSFRENASIISFNYKQPSHIL